MRYTVLKPPNSDSATIIKSTPAVKFKVRSHHSFDDLPVLAECFNDTEGLFLVVITKFVLAFKFVGYAAWGL